MVATEVEIDVLTGEVQIARADILLDCGDSLNPAVDIGQVEGGFIMGLGAILTEEVGAIRARGLMPCAGRVECNLTVVCHTSLSVVL
jgi:xanthine dehydrogenase molybdopterin-binding subunit B